MISYAPLWKMLSEKGISTYDLRSNEILGGGTIERLRKDQSVSTNTLDILCKILNCSLSDVAVYIPD